GNGPNRRLLPFRLDMDLAGYQGPTPAPLITLTGNRLIPLLGRTADPAESIDWRRPEAWRSRFLSNPAGLWSGTGDFNRKWRVMVDGVWIR
ncbi:MAG: hypothetical protein MH204_05485, partial [Fimbriimonadaceae bacterium]|nr:hypothetical protein [Fimbriimonadaceae bacterium]